MYFDSEVLNLLSDDLEEKVTNLEKKYMSFNKKIVDVVNSSNLISFYPLMINDKLNVSRLVSMIDKANGYYYYIEVNIIKINLKFFIE